MRGSGRFKGPKFRAFYGRLVSIPFIAGQWSLRRPPRRFVAGGPPFQSPSLRGSGRFRRTRTCRECGYLVSIPFIAGQWSLLPGNALKSPRCCGVSIPFIAGQWSLRSGAGSRSAGARSFNPLHCGAVVASSRRFDAEALLKRLFQSPSLRGSGRFSVRCRGAGSAPAGFNPLHCGAVVASGKGEG